MTATERFEVIGALYHLRTGRLRPGKDAVFYETNTDENRQAFEVWLATFGFSDALDRISVLEAQVKKLEDNIETLVLEQAGEEQ